MPRRPRKPATRHRGIEAVFSAGRWQWRARTRFLGRDKTGALCETQEQASDDYRALRKRLEATRLVDQRSGPTLGQALEDVLTRAKARRDHALVEQDTGGAVRFLLKLWKPDTPLERIDAVEVDYLVSQCLKIGRHPDTVRRYVRILSNALKAHGLPVPKADIPRAQRTPMDFFEPRELVEILERMRNETFDTEPRNRRRAVAVATFVAMTGIRGGEFCRLTVADVSIERRTISVVAKDRANPRKIPITDALLPSVRELLETAEHGRLIPSVDCWRSMWRRWSKRLGVRLNGRKLRHSFVTSALYSGVILADARDLAGHRHLATTDRYAHEISSRSHDAASRLHNYLAEFGSPPDSQASGREPPPLPSSDSEPTE